jgi:hypothetical protein
LSVQELRWRHQRTAEQLKELDEHLAVLDGHGLEHFHPQEPDARVMKCGGRMLFAYNAQAVVDHESDMVVALDVTSEENDLAQLQPMLQRAEHTLGAVAKQNVADSGYASGEQLDAARHAGFAVLTPIKSECDTKQFPKSSFVYDEERDVYICPRGELLSLTAHSRDDRNATFERAIYRCHAAGCPERAFCSRDPKGRSLKRSPFDAELERQRVLLTKPELRNLYDLRKEIVEHVFGCIKSNSGFRRFTVRGLAKVLAQWALACTAFNLRKLCQTWAAGLLRWDTTPAHA